VLFGDQPFTGTLARNWPQSNDPVASSNSTVALLFRDGFGLKN
jgi:hypothetical protein